MSRWEYRLFHLSNGLVTITGFVYAWMLYCTTSTDEFALVNHPWQPHLLHMHVLFGPLLVLMLGHFSIRHAQTLWKSGVGEGRKTGLGLALLSLPMVMSGYLLQISVQDSWRIAWVAIHLLTSGGWFIACLAHVVIHLLARRMPAPSGST